MSPELSDVVGSMMSKDHNNRPSAEQLLSNPDIQHRTSIRRKRREEFRSLHAVLSDVSIVDFDVQCLLRFSECIGAQTFFIIYFLIVHLKFKIHHGIKKVKTLDFAGERFVRSTKIVGYSSEKKSQAQKCLRFC